MTAFSEPTKWAQSLGATANVDVIPDTAGATDVDISKIFPAVFSVPLAQGGKAIPRKTLNGIFKTLGEWAFYNQNGGVPSYNADFDYTVGRFVSYNGGLYKCIQDNFHTAPHNPTDKDYWAELVDIDNIATDLNGKADKDLSNTTPARAFKDMSIRWGMPDYSSSISVTLPYTAVSDGYLFFTPYDNFGHLLVNGTFFIEYSDDGAGLNGQTGFIPVRKSDKITKAQDGYGFSNVRFVPCKGVN